MARDLFISDLHLSPERPDIIRLFCDFMAETAPGCQRLFILGDFVEYWLGDDDPAPGLQPAFDAMGRLADSGTEIYLMHGNRDFLMGESFAEKTGCTLLQDPSIIRIDGQDVLLMHGDTLCTDDTAYQQLRVMLRNPAWQADFLAKPMEERVMMAKALREKSEQEVSTKSMEIMDVNAAAVEAAFAEHQVSLLIHGHTHRPAVHHLEVQGRDCTRIVLADWYTQGHYLEVNGFDDYRMVDF